MSIKETTLHPENDNSVDLYPKTNIKQVDGLELELNKKTNHVQVMNLLDEKVDKITGVYGLYSIENNSQGFRRFSYAPSIGEPNIMSRRDDGTSQVADPDPARARDIVNVGYMRDNSSNVYIRTCKVPSKLKVNGSQYNGHIIVNIIGNSDTVNNIVNARNYIMNHRPNGFFHIPDLSVDEDGRVIGSTFIGNVDYYAPLDEIILSFSVVNNGVFKLFTASGRMNDLLADSLSVEKI